MQTKPAGGSRLWSTRLPRVPLKNASMGRKHNPLNCSDQYASTNGRSKTKQVSADTPSYEKGTRWQQPQHITKTREETTQGFQGEGSFPQTELSQLTLSQATFFENQDSSSVRSSHSSAILPIKPTYPPLHQNSSVSSSSMTSRYDGGSQGSSRFNRCGVRPSTSLCLGNIGQINRRLQAQIPGSTGGRTGFAAKAGSSVHSRSHLSSSMGPSQLLLRMTPRRINAGTSIRSVTRVRNAAASTASQASSDESGLPRFSSFLAGQKPPDFSQPSHSASEKGPTSADSEINGETQFKAIRADLESLFAERMKDMEGQLRKLETATNGGSLSEEIKGQVHNQHKDLDARIRAINDKIGTQNDKIDEVLNSKSDEFVAKQDELNKGLRMMDDRLATMDRSAASHMEQMKHAAESHLEAMLKSASTSMKNILELAESSTQSLSRKYDDFFGAILPVLQPPVTKMVGSLFKQSTHRPCKPDEESSFHPSSTGDTTPSGVQPKKDHTKASSKSKKGTTYKKRRHSVTTHQANASEESSSNRLASQGDSPLTRRRSVRQENRRRRVSDKENETPSSKIQQHCVTPSGENPQPIGSSANGTIYLKKKRYSEKPKEQTCTISEKQTPKSNPPITPEARERIPFEVVTKKSECPSPLGLRSVQCIQEEVLSGPKRKRSRPYLPNGTKGKKSRSYGKRSFLDGNKSHDDPFAFSDFGS